MAHGAPEPVAALDRVRLVENNEPLVDLRVACPLLVVMARARPYVRRRVAQMLNVVPPRLPDGLRLRVTTALRTIDDQRRHWDGFYARMKTEHPDWPSSALHRATNRFFAPYDHSAPPGHCTGGAVDVQLIDAGGAPLDMTSPMVGWAAAPTWIETISPTAKANRMLMVQAMLGAGFSNCRDEYWHYSYGDSAWAVRVGSRECSYGLVKPPPCRRRDEQC
jgi:D-alanyl-D-alanine dipeptidase